MNSHIAIEVTDAKQCAVPEAKFCISRYKIGNNVMEDLVTTEPPHFHFQTLRPDNEEQNCGRVSVHWH